MTEEKDNADGNEGRPLLPEIEGQQGQVERGGDMPNFDGAKPEDWQDAEVERAAAEAAARKAYLNFIRAKYGKKKGGNKPGEKVGPYGSRLEQSAQTTVVGFVAKHGLQRQINEKFERVLAAKVKLYEGDSLDALHDLAMMPITENTQNNQIKYLAACRLAGEKIAPGGPAQNAALQDIMRELNNNYQKTAPRIKAMRERIVEFENGTEARAIAADGSSGVN
jgi:hypothetical protein